MISVIIPAYNSAKTIRQCVQTVLNQTFKDWELIIIDDGSKDGTFDICKSFVDSRIRVFHQENGGVSSARNLGLKIAQGDYIAFIDSDDFIEADYLQHLSQGLGYDIVISGFCYDNTPESSSFRLKLADRETVGRELTKLINADQLCYPWGRLFKRSIIETYHIRFDEAMRFAEDNVFNWEYLCHAESLYIDATHKDYHKSSDGEGPGYCLSFEEMNYVDGRLFELSKKLEQLYGSPINLETKQLMHVLFLKDMLQLPASGWYEYYKKYHPHGKEKEGYDFIMSSIYYMSLVNLSKTKDKSKQRQILSRIDKFIDKPFTMLVNSSVKTRFLLPIIKMGCTCMVVKLINSLVK